MLCTIIKNLQGNIHHGPEQSEICITAVHLHSVGIYMKAPFSKLGKGTATQKDKPSSKY